MLKSIQSNNSPGHSHNGQTPMVDLSTDSCPGIILKRNNKMKHTKKEENELVEMVREESAKRVVSDGSIFKVISEDIISIGQAMEEGKATPREVEKLMVIKDALPLVVDRFESDVSNWASSFSFGEKDK
jgi:hypothetical protein